MISVREYKPEDKEEFLGLAEELFSNTYFYRVVGLDRERVEQLLEGFFISKQGRAFVAETGEGFLVGIAAVAVLPLWMQPEHYTSQEIMYYVKPEFRRSKAGKKLFNIMEKWSREEGEADSMIMCAPSSKGENETRLGKMYEAKGYSPIEKHYTRTFD